MNRMPIVYTPTQGQLSPLIRSSLTQAAGRRGVRTRGCLECWRQALKPLSGRPISRRHNKLGQDLKVGLSDCSERPCSRVAAERRGHEADTSGAPAETGAGGAPGSTEKAQHRDVGVQAALAVLWLYKNAISPLLPKSCRFLPTCSSYSVEAYQEFGFCKGSALTAWRILRCNPLSKGGFDPPAWPPIGLEGLFQ